MADYPLLRYPKKVIGNQDDYLKIQVLKYEAPGLNLTGGFALRTTEDAVTPAGSVIKPEAVIILPMPANIQDSNAADWVSGTMNPLQASITNAASSGVLSSNLPASVLKSFGNFFENVGSAIKTGEGQKGLSSGTAAAAAQALLGQGDINQAISRASGLVFNSNVELLFSGVSMRPAYNFSFDMVPRSNDEAAMIKTIIRTFKKNMTAQKGNPTENGGGLFVKAPNIFKLEYMSGGSPHPFLHRFKPCALTQMSVNYNGSGQYATYSDATPVHMQLTLQFQELSPIYSENYDTEEGKLGVGY